MKKIISTGIINPLVMYSLGTGVIIICVLYSTITSTITVSNSDRIGWVHNVLSNGALFRTHDNSRSEPTAPHLREFHASSHATNRTIANFSDVPEPDVTKPAERVPDTNQHNVIQKGSDVPDPYVTETAERVSETSQHNVIQKGSDVPDPDVTKTAELVPDINQHNVIQKGSDVPDAYVTKTAELVPDTNQHNVIQKASDVPDAYVTKTAERVPETSQHNMIQKGSDVPDPDVTKTAELVPDTNQQNGIQRGSDVPDPDVTKTAERVPEPSQQNVIQNGSNTRLKTILYWTTKYRGKWSEMDPTGVKPVAQCEHNACTLTGDRTMVKQVDMLLFFNLDPPNFPEDRDPSQLYVHIDRDPPRDPTARYLEEYEDQINLTVNYRRDADRPLPHCTFRPKTRSPYTPRIPL